jgi:hypothetical protein
MKFYILKTLDNLIYKTKSSLCNFLNDEVIIDYVDSYEHFLQMDEKNSYYISSYVTVTNKIKNFLLDKKIVYYNNEVIFDINDSDKNKEIEEIINIILDDFSYFPEDQSKIVFNYNKINSKLNILVNENEQKDIFPYSININVIENCLFDCIFCQNKNQFSKFKIMDLEIFKNLVNIIVEAGIYYIEVTPTRGDFLNIPNFLEYVEFLENHPKVKIYHFFTSFSYIYNQEKENQLIQFYKFAKKARIVASYYGVFGEKDFIERTNTNKKFYESNIKSFKLILNYFNVDYFKIIIRPKNPLDKLKALMVNKDIRNFYFKYKVPFIILPDILNIMDNNILSGDYIYKICTDYMVYSSIDINGNLIFCATYPNNGNNIIQTYDNIIQNGLNIKNMYNNKKMNINCIGCKNYEPVDFELKNAVNDLETLKFNLANCSTIFNNKNYILKE